MLEKIIKLENVGLFAAPLPKVVEFKRTTLIYADNGRGKSTLSAVLRACSTADSQAMAARETIGGSGPPRAQLRFQFPAGGVNVTFDNGAWDAAMPNVVAFDQAFIERNVYAGSEVYADQHQSLLDFALGTAAVKKKKEVDEASEAQVVATRARSAAEGKLQGYRGTMPVATFLALPDEPEADTKIADFERRIANAKAATALAQRASLKTVTLPNIDFVEFEAILKSSFKQVHENAEALVKAHLQTHGGLDAQRWLGDGQRFHNDGSCPFCGQSTKDLEIIEAYGTFFNEQYSAHNRQVLILPKLARESVPDSTVDFWAGEFQANADRLQAWAEQLQLDCSVPNVIALRRLAKEIRDCLEKAAELKARQPLDAVNIDVLQQAIESRDAMFHVLGDYNKAVERANAAIAAFKQGVQAENQRELETSLARVRLQKTRHSADVVAIVDERKRWDAERERQEKAKANARDELDILMKAVLNEYQDDINKWLTHLRTLFRVDRMTYRYVGGTTPRTEYGILLRNKHLVAGRSVANAPSFNTALSDGDKRSLALAFFLAKALHDKTCSESIVVLDDVFASLDSNRRSQTIAAVCEVAKKCGQIIVLAHDAYFLYELQKVLSGEKVPDLLSLQIRRVGEFSELAPADFARMCESDYYKRYRTVADYLDGAAPDDLLPVAQALRVLVEGNLHRRFPGLIREGVTMGVIIGLIENAPAGNPLSQLQPQVKHLRLFNDFAGLFHHDTQGAIAKTQVTDGELHPWAKQAMTFVHLGTMA